MKKDELTALGLTEEQIKGVQALNGKDIETHKTALAAAEKERDTYKGQAETLQGQLNAANATIEKFGDATPESIAQLQTDVEKYKQDAADAQKKYDTDITQRDQKAWIDSQLDEYGVKSPLARKAITAEVMSSENGLQWRNDKFMGFADYMSDAKAENPDLYQTAEEKKAAEEEAKKKESAPEFAGKTGDDGSGGQAFTPPKLF